MGHIYEKNNIKVPSVTTIIQCLGSKRLLKWANYMGFKHKDIDKILEETSEYGTLAHLLMQSIVDHKNFKEKIEIKDKILAFQLNKMATKFKSVFNEDSYETLFSEKTLISIDPDMGYGGTMDWLCKINDKIILYDFKTSKKIKPTMLLQLGAYSKLLEKEENIIIDKAGIILISDSYCKVVEYSKEELDMASEAFLHLLKFYKLYADRLN